MIDIRDIQPADVEAMLTLRERWLSKQRNTWHTTERERSWFSRYPGNKMAPALVALDDRQIVGYILCALMRHPAMPGVSATIDEICVAESHRGEGIGRRLAEELRSQLCATVEDLSVINAQVDHEDETAKAFWTALGLEQHLLEFTDYLE